MPRPDPAIRTIAAIILGLVLPNAGLCAPEKKPSDAQAQTASSSAEKKAGSDKPASPARSKKRAAGAKKTTSHGRVSTEAQAIALVRELKDVKDFFALFPDGKANKSASYPVIEAEKQDGQWAVHVYEQTPDHTATHNWYTVNPDTGSITPMF